MAICIVVQGQTICENVFDIKESWGDYPIVFSTWEDSNKDCYTVEDIVIYNKYPLDIGRGNLNLQRISTLGGLIHAKALGFRRVLKWRQDFVTNNADGLIKLFKKECINLYAFINHRHGYITDFFMEGDIDDIISLFNIDIDVPYSEFAFTKRLYDCNFEFKVNFVCKDLTENCDIFWKKHNYWLTDSIAQDQYFDKLPKERNKAYN